LQKDQPGQKVLEQLASAIAGPRLEAAWRPSSCWQLEQESIKPWLGVCGAALHL